MKVLLLFPSNTHIGDRASHLTSNIESVYPLGVGYIASVLEQNNHEVYFLDFQFPDIPFEKIKQIINLKGIELVGVGASTPNSNQAYSLVKYVKQNFPHVSVVLGGPHIVAISTRVFDECPDVDFIVYGEAEITMKELVDALEKKKPIDDILGLGFKKEGKYVETGRRPFIENLDTIPYPAYHLADLKKYRPVGGMFRALPFANMITSRGCPYKCIFCCKSNWGDTCRMRSVDNIMGEIDLLVEQYKVKEIAFFDDTFTVKRDRVVDLCNRLIEKHPNLIWKCSSRVNHVDLELLKLMKKAGCYSIGYGIESGDNEILRTMRKGITVELSRKAIGWTKEAGIETRGYYMLNNLGDTKQTVEKTIKFSQELDTDFVDFEIVHPLPASPIWDILQNNPNIQIINKDLWYDWSMQAGHYILYLQNDLTEDFLKKAYRRANTGYYLRPSRLLKFSKIAFSNPHMFVASLKGLKNLLRVGAK